MSKEIEKIALEVQAEYQMCGLADGLYLDFATDVAKRYAKRKCQEQRVLCAQAEADSTNKSGSGYPGLKYTPKMYKNILNASEPNFH